MTQEQLKELETLSERWANDPENCPGTQEADMLASQVMDLLPDVLAHIRELESQLATARNEWSRMRVDLEKLTVERDAEQRAAAELLSWATMLANDARDCAPTAPGRLAITLHRWFERDHQPDKPWGSGYHADSEWKPVVDVIYSIAHENPCHCFRPIELCDCAAKLAKHALAHAERITGKEEV